MKAQLRSVLFCLLLFSSTQIFAGKYWVTFSDKNGVDFNPYSYFSERTIAQRTSANISLYDPLDFPVSEKYIDQISPLCDSLSYSSRWLNGIAVYTNAENVELIRGLGFVSSVERMSAETILTSTDEYGTYDMDEYDEALLHYQTDRLGAKKFADHGLNGKGIRIAVFDAGFKGAKTNYSLRKIFDEKRIISTYDFTRKCDDVYVSHWHGTGTLSCIGGELDSVKVGLATGAEFLLARTERVSSEKLSEEEYWLAAAEWADKNGANIISSSLGYTYTRYFNTEMNGRKSLIARAATIAAAKGILVVNAAGNEGNDNWHFIDTPGDADSVLTVGGTDPESDMHINFSSFGPTSDGRMKPNVCAPAHVVCAKVNGVSSAYGTSFSTPLVAGFAACAWQSRRQLIGMELFHEIEKSAHLYPYFDYAHGYGIPQAKYFTDTIAAPEPTFDFVILNDQVKVVLRDKYAHPDEERELGFDPRRNLYYKVENKDGSIKSYTVYLADRKEMLFLQAENFQNDQEITVHFEGYTGVINFSEMKSEEIK